MSLLKNAKPANLAVAGFVIILLGFFACESRAETSVEGGFAMISNNFEVDNFNLILTERWNDKWEIGLGLIGEQTYKDSPVGNNMVVFGQRIIRGTGILDNVFMGIGLGYLDMNRAVGSHLNFMLSFSYNFDNVFISARHFSNAGISPPNPGQNMFNIGYRFK